MNFPHFFIDRPIFAGVISIVITLVGVIALSTLPIAQYPEIAPPTIQVTTNYPGANAKVVSETVATPIEQQVNGVENMLYMSSQSTSDGNMTLSITFKLGTNLDTAQVLVQNRVAIAIPVLPPDVQRIGVTTKKQSPDITMVVHLVSPDGSLDSLFTSNYALLQIRDELARVDGVGDINVFGAREYSMRLWLDPHQLSARGLTAQDVVAAIQERLPKVVVGDGMSPDSEMGPLVTREHRDKVKSYVDLGVKEGASLVVDGRGFKVAEQPDGFFLGGSLFDKVRPEMRIYKEEIFGPVLSVVRAKNFEEALALPSDHEYGNGVAIFTRNGDVARNFTHKVNCGMVGINVPIPVPLSFHSFGGWKHSIFGDMNQHGPEGVRFYTRIKTVTSRWREGVNPGANFGMPLMK